MLDLRSQDEKRRRQGVSYWSLPQGEDIRRQLLQKPRPLSTPNFSCAVDDGIGAGLGELQLSSSTLGLQQLAEGDQASLNADSNNNNNHGSVWAQDNQQKNKAAKPAKSGPRTVIKKILQRRTNEALSKLTSVRSYRSRSLPSKIPLPLHTAILHGTYTDLFSLLAKDKYVDIDQSDGNGVTAVHLTCQLNVHDSLTLLIQCGADVNAKDANGKTPLQYAVCAGSFDCAGTLIQHGGDVNAIKDGCFDSRIIGRSRSKK